MKNKVQLGKYSYTNGWREESSSGSSSGTGDYQREIVTSSTDQVQNIGDRITGTPFGYSVRKCLPFSGSYRYDVTGTKLTVFGNGAFYATFQTVNTMDTSNADNEAIGVLLEKIRGGIDVSVDAFQIGQTIRMLRHPIDSLTAIAKAVRRKTNRRKSFANAWLEYQYGWKPLVSTIFEIAGQAANINSGGPSTQLFTGASHDNARSKSSQIMSAGGTEHMVDIYTDVKYKVKYYALMNLSDSAKAKMAATYTSMNPASIKWELLPYSFVVDWVVDVSGYLRNVETSVLYGSGLAKAWRSTTMVIDTQHLGQPRKFGGATGSLTGSGSYKEIRFSRQIVNGLPVPSSPVISSPTDLSWTRLTSAIALLTQQFAKR